MKRRTYFTKRTQKEESSEEFLHKFNIQFYLREVTAQLLDTRTDKPLEHIAHYFKSVLNGTHVIHKGFNYIQSTNRNRLGFIDLLEQMYAKISDDQRMNVEEFHQLITLLCEDFPLNLVVNIYKTLLLYNLNSQKDENTRKWIDSVAANNSIQPLQTSYISTQGFSIEYPTFMQLRVAFKCYFFFLEFFEIVLHETFQGNFVIHLNLDSVRESVLNLAKEFGIHVAELMSQEEKQREIDGRPKMFYCVPAIKKLEVLFQRAEIVQKDSFIGSQHCWINFIEFCHLFYNYVKDSNNPPTGMGDLRSNIVELIEADRAPISSAGSLQQQARMRKAIAKIMVFHDVQKKGGPLSDRSKNK